MAWTLVTAPAASSRLEAARAWLTARSRAERVLVVGESAEAAAELARSAVPSGAAFGWKHLSFAGLAAWLAEERLGEWGLAPATALGVQAVWARVVQELQTAGALGVFARVEGRPGLPRALARTVQELRLAKVDPARLPEDLARAVREFEKALTTARLADRAQVLELAGQAAPGAEATAVLLLDVSVHSPREADLVQALAQRRDLFASVPRGDLRTSRFLSAVLGMSPTELNGPFGLSLSKAQSAKHVDPAWLRTGATGASTGSARTGRGSTGAVSTESASRLAELQQHLFAESAPTPGPAGDEVRVISAPGEGRECVEIARQIHCEAAKGIPLDRMAIFLRAPAAYRPAIAEALRRAGIPAYFTRGIRQPDPAGRALLALLACAEERLSARRFAEYLSLGELPPPDPTGQPPEGPPDEETWTAAEAAELGAEARADGEPAAEDGWHDQLDNAHAPETPEPPRAPRRWEQLLCDAAVIGHRDRWARRLAGHAEELRRALSAPNLDEGFTERLRRDLQQLEALTRFSLPLIDELAALPSSAPWGEWLERLRKLASRALRDPERVLVLLAELSPMADVGPVGLGEVHRVLAGALGELTARPPRSRQGQVFVGSPEDARGLSFDVVFVPGLAERIFPQRLVEDPILPDVARAAASPDLLTQHDLGVKERLQLHLAVGAASRRITFSYPRLDAEQARPRVPSFYGLEVLRAAEGTLPDFTGLARRAERAVSSRLGWPAPKDPEDAVDAAERDLSILDRLFHSEAPPAHGSARYLVEVNPHLARALRRYGRRVRRRWGPADGLLHPGAEALAALSIHQLAARAFSPTALQHFAACPYRFFLNAIHKLAPRDVPEEIEQLDPLQRGSLVHDTQYRLLSRLRDEGRLPFREGELAGALATLDAVLDEVAARHKELLAPAIDRVWGDAVESIRADLRETLRRMATDAGGWEPWRFELSFGLPGREAADPTSRPEPVALETGLRLRGSIDLVERRADGSLRATDYKTGKARATEGMVVGGGEKLQPVLYALALERLFPDAKVVEGRLFYCTQAGSFTAVSVPLDRRARDEAREVTRIIGGALEHGWFPAAPAPRACTYCDYLEVCGEGEEERVSRKPQQELAELQKLRGLE